MGTCNFKAEKETDNVSGKLLLSSLSYGEESVSVSLCHWERRFRESLESRTEKGETTVRYERNGKDKNYRETVCQLCNQREEAAHTAQASVSAIPK